MATSTLTLTGYLEDWSARPGDEVRLMLSDEREARATVDLVRLSADGAPMMAASCGDRTRYDDSVMKGPDSHP